MGWRTLLLNKSVKGKDGSKNEMSLRSKASAKTFNLFRPHGSFSSSLESCPGREASAAKRIAWLQSQIIGQEAEFESVFGRRRITYADHTATGRSLKYIEDYITSYVLPFYGNTHTSDSYIGQYTTKLVHQACHYIKTRLGGGPKEALLFCGSGSTAAIKKLQEVMGIAIAPTMRERLLQTMKEEEKWVVFAGPYEHHSNLLSWRHSLAEVVEIGLDENGILDMEELKAQLEKYQSANRPLLGSFSACSNVTGLLSDTRKIARVMHEYGAFVCFDFASSGPYEEIGMRSGENDGYDAVFLSPHKFLGGPGTPGILLMSTDLYQLKDFPPSTCGGGTVNFVNGFSYKDTLFLENVEEREDAGTPQIIQKIRAALAFWVKEYVGYKEIACKEHEYVERAFQRLITNKNIEILGTKNQNRLAIMSFLVYPSANSRCTNMLQSDSEETSNNRGKPLHGPFVTKLLNDLFGIQARGGCFCAGPYAHSLLGIDAEASAGLRSVLERGYAGVRPGWTRVSFPYYMSNKELEFILDSLEFIAVYGGRFVPIYNYNWSTGEWSLNTKALTQTLQEKQSNVPVSPWNINLVQPTQTRKVKHTNHKQGHYGNFMTDDTSRKFKSYLETAKQVAVLLPEFSAERKIPELIDPKLVMFRV